MRVARVEWAGFALPFRAPFPTAHGIETHRRGLLIWARLEDGTVGLGEASPLPSFGGGDLEGAGSALAAAGPTLEGLSVEDALARLASLQSAAARFGLETALLAASGRARGRRLAELLTSGQDGTADPVAERVPVNATVGGVGRDEAATAAARAVEAGFRTVKLKVAVTPSVADEVERVAAVRAAIGAGARLRLDANEGWEVDRAVAVLRACAPLDVELVEQPVKAGDLAGLAAVRRAVGIPIAADEAVRDELAARAVLAADAADLLVIKPTIVGGLRAGRRIAELAAAAGRAAIVTTALEAGVGIAAGLHLAASLGPAAGAPTRAHGLATGALLESDLLSPPLEPRRGEMALPGGPGLGVALDPAALARWASAAGREATAC
ncbi:MAG TPA: o-succinylbenzoate synthase [Chloroflexota bacterium]